MLIDINLNQHNLDLLEKKFGKDQAYEILDILRMNLCGLCGIDMDQWWINLPGNAGDYDCYHDERVVEHDENCNRENDHIPGDCTLIEPLPT